jgi:S-adenosylmethionine/arginine decarboxylase-like enzyme
VAGSDLPGTSNGEVQMQTQMQTKTRDIVQRAKDERVWGIASSFDIYDCDPETIRNADKIRDFVVKLCDLIEMKRFGETTVVHFGEDEKVAGFSMMQLIETSLISAHFANLTNTVDLDVFSCKPYDPAVVEKFAQEFFGGRRCTTNVNFRY